MAFTQTHLDALDNAIASGTLVVQYDGKRIQYHTMAELLRARDLIKSELSAASHGAVASSAVAEFSRD